VLSVDGGFKPIDEICRLERIAGAEPVRTWGAGFKVCLACPQAQAAIAHDRDDDEHIGVHPSHNQVCDLLITVTGDQRSAAGQTVQSLLALGEGATSGPVRELYKRRGEADVVTLVHHNARFAEDALREITDKLRAECPEADQVTSEIINYESIFEYPLRCVVSG
jgi:GTP cyclohydrolase FolE2